MRVLLRDDVAGVGRRGDIVEVAGGFARNFLLPGSRAIPATGGLEAQANGMRRARDQREARDRDAAEAQARVLAGALVRVTAPGRKRGRLFGSVGAADVIAAVLQQKGIELSRRQVVLDEPIKEVGTNEVPLHLFDTVATVLTVEVVAAG